MAEVGAVDLDLAPDVLGGPRIITVGKQMIFVSNFVLLRSHTRNLSGYEPS
jgi:hypothetical protein